jgi:oligopeptide transport system ATP-binding protein
MSLLELHDLQMAFPIGGRGGRERRAVDGVSLAIEEHETLGLVGESGCGKSTLARCIVGLNKPTGGQISFDGRDLASLSRRELHDVRREVTMVFQDPFASLNPRRRVRDIVAAPLDVHGMAKGAERSRRVDEMLERVGLEPAHASRFPHEFSGGQRQRIGLARALITQPRLLICDEPVSGLDVSVQAQILNLLTRLQDELDLTLLFIAHDLGVVRHVSQRIAVMYLGRVVEGAEADELFAHPRHPYTEALVAAVPVPDPRARPTDEDIIAGDVPGGILAPGGCRFHPRCPRADAVCHRDDPRLEPLGPEDHVAACHHPLGEAVAAGAERA